MLAAVMLAVVMQSPTGFGAGWYDVGERYRALDVAWSSCHDRALRRAALPSIESALQASRQAKLSEACRAFDAAKAELVGARTSAGDAMCLRFTPEIVDPGTLATLKVTWAYSPADVTPVVLEVGPRRLHVIPGRVLTLQIDLGNLNPDLKIHPEAGYLLPARIGGKDRGVPVSLIKHGATRIAALALSKNLIVKGYGKRLADAMAHPERAALDPPHIDWLFQAEQLEDGTLSLDRADELFVVDEGDAFRVAFPETLRGARPVEPVSVVIALYGEENSFANWFQGFGQGSAVKEALARHWVFVAARAGRRPEAAIAWLRKAKGLKVGNVFVIGYDMGADVASAFERAGADPSLKLAALAFIAPLPAAEPRALGSVPTYCAVGAQDTVGVSANPFSSESTNGRSDFQIQIFDPCGHGVLVGESIPSVYGFFDRFARR